MMLYQLHTFVYNMGGSGGLYGKGDIEHENVVEFLC